MQPKAIGEVFGDWALADDLRTHEERVRTGADVDVIPEIGDAIRRRYDLNESDHEPAAPPAARRVA